MSINPFKPFIDALNASSEAQEVVDLLRKVGLSQAQRKEFFDAMEVFAKAGAIPPVHLVEVFARIIATQRIDGHDLVAFGRSGIGVQIQAGVLASLGSAASWPPLARSCDSVGVGE